MEQKKAELNWVVWVSVALSLCVLTSCKKPEEHPENLDPIYADLTAQAAGFRGKEEAQKKKIEEMAAKLEKYGPRDPEAKHTAYEKENLERGLIQIQQEAEYFEIRAEQRRLYDKESYMKAFNADLPWPPPEDYLEYQQTKKLKLAPRDWDKSVPVDKSHNKPVEDKKKKKEEKKEG